MTNATITNVGGATVCAGRDAVEVFRANALASGIRLYAKTKMLPNRMWTPTNMLKAAGSITGKTYKRGQYEQAAIDLKAWADAQIGVTVNA